MNRRQLLRTSTSLAVASAIPFSVFAQDKAITFIVPFAAGGSTDMLGRTLAQQFGNALGRAVVVDNKPGAGSGIGAALVARAKPDGDTLLVATSTTIAINPALYKKLAYDPVKDFAPIGLMGSVPLVLVVNRDLPVQSVGELVDLSKSRPQGLTYGSAGNGTPQHLAAEIFRKLTGANLLHVPYKGSGPAVTDLLGGQISLMFSDIPPAQPHVRAGKLKALGVTSSRRQPALPGVGTIAESKVPGTKDFDVVAWQCLLAPAGTPRDIVLKHAAALEKALAQPELRAQWESEGIEPAALGGTPDRFANYIRTEIARWGKVTRDSGAMVD